MAFSDSLDLGKIFSGADEPDMNILTFYTNLLGKVRHFHSLSSGSAQSNGNFLFQDSTLGEFGWFASLSLGASSGLSRTNTAFFQKERLFLESGWRAAHQFSQFQSSELLFIL